ncbi:MAG: Uma2 family endonuclease [Gemmataceae bacterium]
MSTTLSAPVTPPPVMHSTLTPLSSIVGLRRFTVVEYRKMLEAGILFEGEKVELLEGLVVEKGVRNQPHENGLRRLSIRFPRYLPSGYILQVQGAIRLSDSEPEPDGAVIRGDETTCDNHFPGPDDLPLLIEVSDSTLGRDRRDKGRMYSRSNVPIYWIVNVADGWIEVYTNPDPAANPPAYLNRRDYLPGQDVPLILDGVQVSTIPAADLLP